METYGSSTYDQAPPLATGDHSSDRVDSKRGAAYAAVRDSESRRSPAPELETQDPVAAETLSGVGAPDPLASTEEDPAGEICPLWESIYRREMPDLTVELLEAFGALYPDYVSALQYGTKDFPETDEGRQAYIQNLVALGLLGSRNQETGAFRWRAPPAGLEVAAVMISQVTRAQGSVQDRYSLACGLVNDPSFAGFYTVDQATIEEAMADIIEHSDIPALDNEEDESEKSERS
jgi:hypothetical protein